MGLTVKQEKFINKYLECGNASEAYRYAYSCENMKDESISNKAYELINKVEITARLKEMQQDLKEASDITKERILSELSAILDSKITDYINLVTERIEMPLTKKQKKAGEKPQMMEIQVLRFKDFSQLTERQIKAIESVKQGKNGIELKLHGKSWTIERICKMLGFDTPKDINIKFDPSELTDNELKKIAEEYE